MEALSPWLRSLQQMSALQVASALAAILFLLSLRRIASSVYFLTSARHSCGPAASPPRTDGVFNRYFRSQRTGLWVYHTSYAPLSSAPRCLGTVYLIHGMGEHAGRYESLSRSLASHGFIVHACDHQGHGQSEGDRSYFAALDDLVADVIQLVTVEKPAPAGFPRFLVGHSLGGLVALHVAAATQPLWKGLILSGPALSFDPAVDTCINRTLARTLKVILPKLPVQGVDPSVLCSDEQVCAQFMRDPLNYTGGIRVRVGCEIIDGVTNARAFAGSLTLPLLIVHGQKDTLCGIRGSEEYMDLVASTDKQLLSYVGMKHEIFLEKTGDAVVRDVIDWMRARV